MMLYPFEKMIFVSDLRNLGQNADFLEQLSPGKIQISKVPLPSALYIYMCVCTLILVNRERA